MPQPSVIEERVTVNELKIKGLGEKIEDLNHDLFGNGQPGAIGRLEAKIERIEEKMGKVLVYVAVLAGGAGFGATEIVRAIFGGG